MTPNQVNYMHAILSMSKGREDEQGESPRPEGGGISIFLQQGCQAAPFRGGCLNKSTKYPLTVRSCGSRA